MSLLEQAAARVTLAVVRGTEWLWVDCDRCGTVRQRWHRHELAPVLELHGREGRPGGAA